LQKRAASLDCPFKFAAVRVGEILVGTVVERDFAAFVDIGAVRAGTMEALEALADERPLGVAARGVTVTIVYAEGAFVKVLATQPVPRPSDVARTGVAAGRICALGVGIRKVADEPVSKVPIFTYALEAAFGIVANGRAVAVVYCGTAFVEISARHSVPAVPGVARAFVFPRRVGARSILGDVGARDTIPVKVIIASAFETAERVGAFCITSAVVDAFNAFLDICADGAVRITLPPCIA
jgi:hypothetical protein